MERPMGELIPTKLAAAFHLGLAQNAVNFAGDGLQNANGWSAFDPIEFVKSYNEGKLHIVLKMSTGVGFGDYDLVLFTVKDGSHDSNASSENHSIGDVPPTCHADRHQEPMFVGITEFVECPEGIIPSFMRVERPKERLDFLREVFAPPLSVRIKFGGGISKWKISVLGLDGTTTNSDSVSALVQSGSQRLDGLDRSIGPTVGDLVRELVRVDRNAFCVCLRDKGAWFLFEESCDALFKPTDLILCAA
jgi:hypothetical protein